MKEKLEMIYLRTADRHIILDGILEHCNIALGYHDAFPVVEAQEQR